MFIYLQAYKAFHVPERTHHLDGITCASVLKSLSTINRWKITFINDKISLSHNLREKDRVNSFIMSFKQQELISSGWRSREYCDLSFLPNSPPFWQRWILPKIMICVRAVNLLSWPHCMSMGDWNAFPWLLAALSLIAMFREVSCILHETDKINCWGPLYFLFIVEKVEVSCSLNTPSWWGISLSYH